MGNPCKLIAEIPRYPPTAGPQPGLNKVIREEMYVLRGKLCLIGGHRDDGEFDFIGKEKVELLEYLMDLAYLIFVIELIGADQQP